MPGGCSAGLSSYKEIFLVCCRQAACFVSRFDHLILFIAFPQTFGVFQNYYKSDRRLSNASHSIWIGVLSTGIPFLGAPFMTAICDAHPKMKWRHYVVLGWAICFLSLFGAAFCKSLLPLAITQGVLYGVGLMILDVPVLLILNTWFDKRRGTAYGLLFGVTDLIGFGATILAEYLLRKHTLRGALLTFACALVVICGSAMWLLRSRPVDAPPTVADLGTPVAEQILEKVVPTPFADRAASNFAPVTTRYYRRPIFYIFTLANVFHSLAYYLPFIYLPSYTTNLGYSSERGAYILAGANFAQIFGEVGFGALADLVNVHCLVMLCTLGSSIATLGLWGFAHSLVRLAWFALIFGTFGSGLISLWARMGTFFGQEDAQMIYSVMSFGRGVGVIISGPISTALLTATASHKERHEDGAFRYGNGKYLGLVLFVGAAMFLAALMGIFGLVAGWHQKELGNTNPKAKTASQDLEV